MYQDFFTFSEAPFSIVPNSRYLFLSQRHKEAIQHLEAGLGEGGGFAMLTGEVGTGKTTVAKVMLANLGNSTQAGLILNPTFSNIELLEAICDEFSVTYSEGASLKQLSQAIYQFLLDNHGNGLQTLLVIDEAQHLAADVLEQLRLLTNLETDSQKLLKVLLIGQPELQQKLKTPQLRQLAQRITGRYHLLPLTTEEAAKYIQFRLERAGGDPQLFPVSGLKFIAIQTLGIPRLINLVCDAVLKSAYQAGVKQPNKQIIQSSCQEVMQFQTSFSVPLKNTPLSSSKPMLISLSLGVVVSIAIYLGFATWANELKSNWGTSSQIQSEPQQVVKEILSPKLKQQLMQSSTLEQSISDLYQVWGYRASVLDRLCDSHRETSRLFHCEQQQGDWNDLLTLNRPVVIHLDIDQQIRFAVLSRVNADYSIELIFNGQRVVVDSHWIQPLWTGDYHYIWQSQFKEVLRKGMSGGAVAQLDKVLSELIGETPNASAVFDDQLERKVMLFQRWQNMSVDGIAGQQTLKALEQLTQNNAPELNAPEQHTPANHDNQLSEVH
ncbi:AAA family ATPase [Vibrio sp. ZSDE26]|uniref:AAA family ATPase n=2 Tax=Vibrio amylolyticus TaxID=2847292 RepID=A0A9X1XLR8_9VIBR|nr:ExeA family protein [Vibrio amylolyticus]MCK6264776.1 AAA family ATPase [Vibrio amylolyticus]